MANFHTKVSLRGFHFEEWILTCTLAVGITANDVGKAVSYGGAANTVKLAADGDVILGKLASVEDRKVEGTLVGSVEFKFSDLLPVKVGDALAAGDSVVGGGGGTVKKATAADHTKSIVWDVANGYAVVTKF